MTYEQIAALVEERRAEMQAVLDFMEAHPAAGYREWESSNYLEKAYRDLGYAPTMAGNIPGFYVDVDTGKPGPRILVLSELDGLSCPDHPNADPNTGVAHACGHHAQCAALYGVAAALRVPEILEGLCGSIRLCVVPAEELGELEFREGLRRDGIIHYFGGKQEFLRRGYFDGCDMAFMIHTGGGQHHFTIKPGCNGSIMKTAEFIGKATHAAAPRHGINALYAANLSLSAINALRETFNNYDFVRVHPIIVQGGTVVNAIPSRVLMENQVRASTVDACTAVNIKINRAVAASAAAIGANVKLRDIPGYMPGAYDKTLTRFAMQAMAEVVGEENVRYIENPWDTGCSDMGDLSQVMPAVHAFGSGSVGAGHGPNYRIADFDSACMDSAKAQLVLLRDLLSDDAAAAKEVIANATVRFASFEEYFAVMDSIFTECTAVEKISDHELKLNF